MSGRVLITGASGFLGKPSLAALKRRGFDVVAVSRRPIEGASTVQCDLLEREQVDRVMADVRPSHLLHLAWDVTHGQYWSSPTNLDWVRASLQLLTCFADLGGCRAVFAGTCAEYDWSYGFCSEGVTPYRPATLYGVAKSCLRELALAYAKETKLSVAWGHVFFPYGPAEHPQRVVAATIRSVLRGQVARCSPGTQLRDYLHADDVGDAFAALLDGPVQGAVNIASGEPISIGALVTRIGEQLGRPELIALGALPSRAGDPPLVLGDHRRLVAEVGWRPRRTLDEGLASTIEWWRNDPGDHTS